MRGIFKVMRKSTVFKKSLYFLTCILFAGFLSGCKEKGGQITIFDGLSDSEHVSSARTALENKESVVVSFTAEWCPHCRAYKPVFSEVGDSFKGKAIFINIDVDSDEGSAISNKFQVRGIPTTAFVRADGSVFKVQVGGIQKDELTEIVNKLIKNKRRKRGEPVAPFPIEPTDEEKTEKVEPKEDKPPQDLIEEKTDEEQKELDKPEESDEKLDKPEEPMPGSEEEKTD